MAKCKKCGKELEKSSKILSVKTDSETAKKELKKNDLIFSLDDKSVSTKKEIESAIKGKDSCEIKIQRKNQTETIKIENPSRLLNDIEFYDEGICSSCGSKQKNMLPIVLILIAVLIAGGIVGAVIFSEKSKEIKAGVEFEDNNSEFVEDKVGEDGITSLENPDLTVTINDKEIKITSLGALPDSKVLDNLEDLKSRATPTNNSNGNNVFPDFDDSMPAFREEKVGTDTYRKMYAKNGNFDIRKPVISEYNFNDLTQNQLEYIGESKCELLGTVYFDYGYANWPKEAVVRERKTSFGRIEFNEIRYTETMSALLSILSEIPLEVLDTTVFYLDGHTDHTSPHDFNQTLSEARADCIKEILIQKFGISEKNIITKGHSWDCLAVDTLEECAENRRVEIRVAFFN